MVDLQALKKELAEKQKTMEDALDIAANAANAYLGEFNKWQDENKALVTSHTTTAETSKSTKNIFQSARKRIGDELSAHFTERPEDAKIEPAFGVRRSVEAVYEDDIEFIQAVVKSGMLFLLKPDQPAITAFIKGMAKEGENPLLQPYSVIPPKVFDSLPVLGIQTIFKATISDKKLQG